MGAGLDGGKKPVGRTDLRGAGAGRGRGSHALVCGRRNAASRERGERIREGADGHKRGAAGERRSRKQEVRHSEFQRRRKRLLQSGRSERGAETAGGTGHAGDAAGPGALLRRQAQ